MFKPKEETTPLLNSTLVKVFDKDMICKCQVCQVHKTEHKHVMFVFEYSKHKHIYTKPHRLFIKKRAWNYRK